MFFDPESWGVCGGGGFSPAPPPVDNASCVSVIQLTAAAVDGTVATRVSVPSTRDRIRIVPPAARYAIRVPSCERLGLRGPKSPKRGTGAVPSSGKVLSAVPPPQNSSVLLSGLQKTLPGTPSLVSCAGFAEPSAGTT